jgi:hypothetical protein
VRHKDNTGRWSRWSDYLQFVPSPPETVVELRGNLVFSEIMFNPPDFNGTDGDEFEFLELQNIGTNTLNLSGIFFSAGINFTFTNGTTLTPGARFLLGRNVGALQSKYPGLNVNGVYTGRLDNGGEDLTLRHPLGFDVLSVTYVDNDPAGLAADGLGFSLVLSDPAEGTYRAGTAAGGSPGALNPAPNTPAVVINEALTSSPPPTLDEIEIHNATGAPVDIGGWYLTDDRSYPWKYRFPNGTIVAANGYVRVDENEFNFPPGVGASFGLSSLGDQVYLFAGNASAEITGYSHGFQFGGARSDVSFGRYVNSAGVEQFPAQISNTLGGVNSGPRVGPVVINEIQYNPLPGGDEFIELLNVSGSPVPLYDPLAITNTWILNGFGLTFPQGVSIAPGQLILLVAGDSAVFRTRYGIPGGVPIFGLVTGGLQDSGERLELLAPDSPTTNGTPFYAVDVVRYNDRLPWLPAADGAGASLQRLLASAYGDEPTNWTAAIPTPGALLPVGTKPTITTPPTNTVAVAGQVAVLSVSAVGPGPLSYQWRFNNNRLASGTNSTLLLPDVATTQAGNYSVDVFNRFGAVSSGKVSLTILTPAYITQQPQPLIVRPGTNVTFTVAATSRTPFTYQWRFNGVPIPGETAETLEVNNVQLEQDGLYDAVITDGVGPAVSDPARLTVLVNPVIVQPPLSQTVVAGGDVTVSVGITGNPGPFGYQWRRTSLVFPLIVQDEKTCFFTFTDVQPSQGGPGVTYRIVVTNAASTGIAVNTSFFLTVLPDTDGDGLPDEWELANQLLTNAPDAMLDFDMDGVSNGAEYIAGTSPTNALSYLKVEQITANGPASIQFYAVSNRTYTVQYKSVLSDPDWKKLAGIVAQGIDRTETVVDPAPDPKRFYRLVTPGVP